MLIIRVFHLLDQYTCALSVLDERQHNQVDRVHEVESIAYTTFAYPPDGDAEDVITMVRAALECGQGWVTEHAGGRWFDVL